jgi:phosphoribosylformimino-5-aminoimidazole carboxamide ribotide isomerase
MMELVPAIDLRNGRVVRLFQGDFAAETRYELSPVDLYRLYLRSGAARIHVVDLDGARDGRAGNRDIVASLAALGTARIQSGGGLRSADGVRALLETGVDRAVIGSVAVTATDEVAGWLGEFGPDRLVVALDVRIDGSGVPRVASHGWREQSTLSLWDLVGQLEPAGLRHVLCTDVSRDGALTGPNLPLYREAMRRFPALSWQASGGIRSAADLEALAGLELAAAVSGKALIEGRIPPGELKPFLPGA